MILSRSCAGRLASWSMVLWDRRVMRSVRSVGEDSSVIGMFPIDLLHFSKGGASAKAKGTLDPTKPPVELAYGHGGICIDLFFHFVAVINVTTDGSAIIPFTRAKGFHGFGYCCASVHSGSSSYVCLAMNRQVGGAGWKIIKVSNPPEILRHS